jgi:hypothetical protein
MGCGVHPHLYPGAKYHVVRLRKGVKLRGGRSNDRRDLNPTDLA